MRFKLPDELTRNILFWIQEKRWLLIIVFLGTLMYNMPYPDGISIAGYRTLILGVIVIFLIITEPVPLPAVGAASPWARKLAGQLGISLESLTGSGPGGVRGRSYPGVPSPPRSRMWPRPWTPRSGASRDSVSWSPLLATCSLKRSPIWIRVSKPPTVHPSVFAK